MEFTLLYLANYKSHKHSSESFTSRRMTQLSHEVDSEEYPKQLEDTERSETFHSRSVNLRTHYLFLEECSYRLQDFLFQTAFLFHGQSELVKESK